MRKAVLAGAALAVVLVLLALVLALGAGRRARTLNVAPAGAPASVSTPATAAVGEAEPGFLHGRITLHGGATYEGRLRWGGAEEAFWGDYFNGRKDENRWAAHVPPEMLPAERRRPLEIFGFEIGRSKPRVDLGRPFMARFGDIARIDARVAEVQVTLKSGAVLVLDRLDANDLDDGVRVWDRERGVVDLDHRLIRTVELLPGAPLEAQPARLHGTVRTRHGEYTGFLQWNREEGVGSDELHVTTGEGPLALRFDTIRSIARRPRGGSEVTLLDGREIVLTGGRDVGDGNRGVYVDDRRYGRVLVSWDAFERVDLSPGGSGPAYGDFPPGSPLTGSVTTRDGRRLSGRLVYDLDESETTETLDAPSEGVDYTIPFGLVASVAPRANGQRGGRASVILHSGEELQLEHAGDLGAGNAGMLVFVDGRERPEYVPWSEVGRIELARPPAMYPPLDAS